MMCILVVFLLSLLSGSGGVLSAPSNGYFKNDNLNMSGEQWSQDLTMA
eukprot:CAMPEP_0175110846 /NCGR_PEP_ID=MMETSP0086_2-20121207/14376_1 /TAXON_ID=136419 /ORGANISM="Unknown Unknown, Strain D1" /LENGTH=47 /DNA_ID= /DNA_START= /DNA_END= /DNA_ORIENTATION=